MYPLLFAGLLSLTIAVLQLEGASDLRLYQIGNSHTWDSAPSGGLGVLFESAGFDLTNGWHVRCSKPLSYIVENPDDVCVASNEYGTWLPAISENRWDGLVFQSFYGATGASELDAIESILAAQPSHYTSKVYLYVNWPKRDQQEFREGWQAAYTSANSSVAISNAYFIWLSAQLRKQFGGRYVVECIPVGAVFNELDQRFRAGDYLPFEKVDDIYRDDYHLNNVGRYVVGLTFLSVVMNYDVRQLGAAPDFYNTETKNFHRIDLDLANYLQEIVWQVVPSKPFASGSLPFGGIFQISQNSTNYSFQTHTGYDYTLLQSDDLETWQVGFFSKPGDGLRWSQRSEKTQQFYRIIRD